MNLDIGTVWRVAAITVTGGLVAAVAAAFLAVSTGDPGSAYVMRGVVMTLVVVATVVIAAARAVRLDLRDTLAVSVVAGTTIGLVLNPGTWSGQAYIAQLMVESGSLAALIDLVLVVALAAALTATLGARLVEQETPRSVDTNSYIGNGGH